VRNLAMRDFAAGASDALANRHRRQVFFAGVPCVVVPTHTPEYAESDYTRDLEFAEALTSFARKFCLGILAVTLLVLLLW
jgi:hypothetical protein